ncbi:MAG: A/G-specific adenine glycosylase, partial [Acidobacteria bacterium]|nr:A/G-specific adenine glycosylase [Acidobacteriota bacterium]
MTIAKPQKKIDLAWVAKSLVAWYRRHRRDLPWRRTRDPYRIWISEVMLQQTQVSAVVPYYLMFVERFPSLASLAEAKEEAVLAAWSGLGYYRRARNLHAAARRIRAEFGG